MGSEYLIARAVKCSKENEKLTLCPHSEKSCSWARQIPHSEKVQSRDNIPAPFVYSGYNTFKLNLYLDTE